jgi:hypothetical protein
MATSTLGSGTLVLAGTTSGTTTVTATAVAGTTTLTLPAATDTLVGKATTDTLTNKTLTGAAMNGTLGATTPSTVAATTLTTSSTVTHNGGTANGVGYLDGSKVLTTGSALSFDGTQLSLGGATNKSIRVDSSTSNATYFGIYQNQGQLTINRDGATGTFTNTGLSAATILLDGSSGGSYIAFATAAANNTGPSERARIDSSGNLIINDTSRIGSARLSMAVNASTENLFAFKTTTNGEISALRGLNSAGSEVVAINYDTTNSALLMRTGSTERARIDSSGNLLVGTTSANGRLSIDSAGTTSATYIIFGRNSAASNKFTVRSDGAGFLDSAAWTYGSDATIKENIEYLEPSNCLSLLLNAKPAKFDYIEGQKTNYGYIAQDVQKWLPEAVSETPNGKLGLQDGFINAIGTGAIQALHQLIQEQQALITQLTARISALESA